MPYKIYLIKVAENSAAPAEVLFQRAIFQETILFNSPKDVSNFIKKQYKRGIEYFGKHGDDGKEPALFFLLREKRIIKTDRLYQ